MPLQEYFSRFHSNTTWNRAGYENLCPNKQSVYHFYATLQEGVLTQAYINFHINPESCKNSNYDAKVQFKLKNELESKWRFHNITQGEYSVAIEEYSKRNIYSVLLKDLAPNSLCF